MAVLTEPNYFRVKEVGEEEEEEVKEVGEERGGRVDRVSEQLCKT